jgi:hypothetical protein
MGHAQNKPLGHPDQNKPWEHVCLQVCPFPGVGSPHTCTLQLEAPGSGLRHQTAAGGCRQVCPAANASSESCPAVQSRPPQCSNLSLRHVLNMASCCSLVAFLGSSCLVTGRSRTPLLQQQHVLVCAPPGWTGQLFQEGFPEGFPNALDTTASPPQLLAYSATSDAGAEVGGICEGRTTSCGVPCAISSRVGSAARPTLLCFLKVSWQTVVRCTPPLQACLAMHAGST